MFMKMFNKKLTLASSEPDRAISYNWGKHFLECLPLCYFAYRSKITNTKK